MDEHLYQLKTTNYREYNDITDLIVFLKNFFGKDFKFPLVVGDNDESIKNWREISLECDLNSQSFIRDYVDKLQIFKEYEEKSTSSFYKNKNLFEGNIRYHGLRSFNESISNKLLFEANLKQKALDFTNAPQQMANLSIYLGKDIINENNLVYYARIKKTPSIIDLIFK
ncbi:MAG: hypothetical protein AB7V77_01020 [Candidatus Woesearchaeota archaeon]